MYTAVLPIFAAGVVRAHADQELCNFEIATLRRNQQRRRTIL
jgi:hypothetical protein